VVLLPVERIGPVEGDARRLDGDAAALSSIQSVSVFLIDAAESVDDAGVVGCARW
jgi:hypothetical protein